jgi:hypothetical protein
MNSRRASAFARWDVQLNKDFLLRGIHMELYLGANNILIAIISSPTCGCPTGIVLRPRSIPCFDLTRCPYSLISGFATY